MPITHVVPVRHDESPAVVTRRRRVVAGISLLGAPACSASSLRRSPDRRRFYVLTADRRRHLDGWAVFSPDRSTSAGSRAATSNLRRPLLVPVATGVGAFGFFYGCALVARRIPFLDQAISRVLAFAEEGNGPLVLLTTYANGIGEEIFFRGALYAALAGRPRRRRLHPGLHAWPPRPPATRRWCSRPG